MAINVDYALAFGNDCQLQRVPQMTSNLKLGRSEDNAKQSGQVPPLHQTA